MSKKWLYYENKKPAKSGFLLGWDEWTRYEPIGEWPNYSRAVIPTPTPL